jgi:hypothetical protein
MIKAIETIYNGYRFRSRLEARWAVFFDALEIEYQYELEGFFLTSGLGIPKNGLYVEIKGVDPSSKESLKLLALSDLTKTDCLLLYGNVDLKKTKVYGCYWEKCNCPDCINLHLNQRYTIGLSRWGVDQYLPYWYKLKEDGVPEDELRNLVKNTTEFIEKAWLAARQARFEHGENGIPL